MSIPTKNILRYLFRRQLILMVLFIIATGTAGCSNFLSRRDAAHNALQPVVLPEAAQRFQIIYEHSETLNTGGFTILRDNKTGVEYLIVTGLNGAPSVTELKTKP